jgi:endoglycosylceramidase
VVILHGLQIDRFEPTAPIEYIDLNPANVRFMAAEGFNLARVSLAYAGVEPRIGHIDHRYVGSYLSFDRKLGRAGIYDLIDMMQGQYSAKLDGWGFPDWMAVTGAAQNARRPFPQGYFANPAENTAWDNLWADAVAGDRVGLQEHYAAGLRHLAGSFAQAPGLLGLEILNEPWPGSRWSACANPGGCPAFDSTLLTAFYRRMIAAVRSADRRHLIAIEPNLLFDFGSATALGPLSDPNLVFAFHDYCLANAIGLPFPRDSTGSCGVEERQALSNAEAQAQRSSEGLLMDEWGNSADTTLVQRVADEADQHMLGWANWA